jgi:hypothetical protein
MTSRKKPVRRKHKRAPKGPTATDVIEEIRLRSSALSSDVSELTHRIKALETTLSSAANVIERLLYRPLQVLVGCMVYGNRGPFDPQDRNRARGCDFAMVRVHVGMVVTERFIDHAGNLHENRHINDQPSMAIIARGELIALIHMHQWNEIRSTLGVIP